MTSQSHSGPDEAPSLVEHATSTTVVVTAERVATPLLHISIPRSSVCETPSRVEHPPSSTAVMAKPIPTPLDHISISDLEAQSDISSPSSESPTTSLEAFLISNDAEAPSPLSVYTTNLQSSLLSASPSQTTLVEPAASTPATSTPATSSSSPGPMTSRPAAKKALLIGINYMGGEGSPQGDALTGPHRDVMCMKKILAEVYGFVEVDIVVVIDGTGYLEQTPDNIKKEKRNQPTRDNILRELKNLVNDAQPGDHFLFHYAGHSDQQPTKSVGEEDGQDELIVTSDYKHIVDKELRTILVESLPSGSSLLALFDTCHSATMLDLEHYRCNRVYTPWINRRSDSWEILRICESRHGSQGSSKAKSGLMRLSNDERPMRLLRGRSLKSQKRISERTRTSSSLESFFSDLNIRRCESPDSALPCVGDCRESADYLPSPTDYLNRPYVMSVSACKDSQLCWETPKGDSMTQALIRILRENPHPPLKDLLTGISHDLYQTSLEVHKHIRKNKQDGEARGETVSDAKEHFQDPQIASHKPLDMTALFTLDRPHFLQGRANL